VNDLTVVRVQSLLIAILLYDGGNRVSLLGGALTENWRKWDADPFREFDDFIGTPDFVKTGHGRRRLADDSTLTPESRTPYLAMFGKFCRWLESHGRRFTAVTAGDVSAFLAEDGRALNSAISRRYLRLLERCYLHLGVFPNPAQHALFAAARDGTLKNNDATVVLTDDEVSKLLAALPSHSVKYPRGGMLNGWKRRRDRAMQLTMLCAGLKVSEVIGLLLPEVPRQPELDGSLRLNITPAEKNVTSVPHVATLRPIAVAEVLAWVDERIALPIPGARVFPANEEGELLNPSTVYRQVQQTFARAGVAAGRLGGRTLRNTFAVQDIRAGVPLETVAENLGLAFESVDLYRAAAKIK